MQSNDCVAGLCFVVTRTEKFGQEINEGPV